LIACSVFRDLALISSSRNTTYFFASPATLVLALLPCVVAVVPAACKLEFGLTSNETSVLRMLEVDTNGLEPITVVACEVSSPANSMLKRRIITIEVPTARKCIITTLAEQTTHILKG
jgi:hypothetical protein